MLAEIGFIQKQLVRGEYFMFLGLFIEERYGDYSAPLISK